MSQSKQPVDTYAIGVHLADQLRKQIQWIEPLDWNSYKPKQMVIVGYDQGPIHVRLGYVHLAGWMRISKGEDEMASIAVQVKDSVHLFVIEAPGLNPSEQHDLEKILTVARRALVADDHRRSYIPGKVATTRWSWSYQHATMNY
jgi:hypothetical protein